MKLLQTISIFASAFLVLLSSSSFMVGIHFCKGEAKHFALFAKAAGCKEETKLPPCHKHQASPCCDDKTVMHEGEGFKASSSEITISNIFFSEVTVANVLVSEIIPADPSSRIQYHNYDPPLPACDLTVTHRTLLI